jgi:hypothetical protein
MPREMARCSHNSLSEGSFCPLPIFLDRSNALKLRRAYERFLVNPMVCNSDMTQAFPRHVTTELLTQPEDLVRSFDTQEV